MKNNQNNTAAESSGYGTSYGVTNGNVKHDNRVINVHNSTCGHVVTIICLTVTIALLIILIGAIVLFSSKGEKHTVPQFDINKNELKIGKQGGVYFIDENGLKTYLDREKGLKLYEFQQKQKKKTKGNMQI